jgi:hypothetical protein
MNEIGSTKCGLFYNTELIPIGSVVLAVLLRDKRVWGM